MWPMDDLLATPTEAPDETLPADEDIETGAWQDEDPDEPSEGPEPDL